MLDQIIRVIRLLGLRRAVRMKKHHEEGLKYIRGYAACMCWWVLMEEGLLDGLEQEGQIEPEQFACEKQFNEKVLRAVIEYLTGIGLLEQAGKKVRLSETGKALLAEPRGMFELLWAYEPCFRELGDLLKGKKQYGRDLTRRITYVGLGSGRLCEQLPYPVMRQMVRDRGAQQVLDLGCGDMAFLAGLCQMDEKIRGHGIDYSEEMVRFDEEQLKQNDYGGRLTVQVGDMFDLPELPEGLGKVDCITACDTFHEYLQDEDKLVALLQALRAKFDGAVFVIGEFCLQDAAWLRKHKTASLEHHLFHELSGQQIGTAQQWREIFDRTGLGILEEQVYDLIGHGYFALR